MNIGHAFLSHILLIFWGEFIPQMPVAEAHLWYILFFMTSLTVWGHYWRTYYPKWEIANNFWFSYKYFEFLTFFFQNILLPHSISVSWSETIVLFYKLRLECNSCTLGAYGGIYSSSTLPQEVYLPPLLEQEI